MSVELSLAAGQRASMQQASLAIDAVQGLRVRCGRCCGGTLAAFFSRSLAGGVFRMKVKLRSCTLPAPQQH